MQKLLQNSALGDFLQNALLQRIFAKLGLQNFAKSSLQIPDLQRVLQSSGWRFYVNYVGGKLYLRAWNRSKWVSLGQISEEELKLLSDLGLLKRRRNNNGGVGKHSKLLTCSSRSSQKQVLQSFAKEGVGGRSRCVPTFVVHRLGLRFVRSWVSPLFLRQLGGVRFVERSRQWVVRLEVGVKRWLTVQVNRDGSAQVFLEASDNPLSVEEFIGFCKFYLLEVFRRITGREVSLEDFEVMVAPEVNCDLGGVKILEGVKSLTLQEYYDGVVRIYYCPPGAKVSMPEGGTRNRVQA